MCPLPETICSSIGLNTDSSNRVKGFSSRSILESRKSPVKNKIYNV